MSDKQESDNNTNNIPSITTAGTASLAATTPKATHLTTSSNSKRLCRNVIIHGFCKYENKGCEFNHMTAADTIKQTTTQQQQQGTNFSESAKANTSVSVNAPIFVPTSSSATTATVTTASYPTTPYSTNRVDNNIGLMPQQPQMQPPYPFTSEGLNTFHSLQTVQPTLDPSYYYTAAAAFNQPMYHQYAPSLPHISNLTVHQRLLQSFYVPDNLKEQLVKRNEVSYHQITVKNLKLPEEVHVYHSLCPLEEKPGKLLGHPSWVYKATSRVDGRLYTLVRIEGFRLVNEQAMKIVKLWQKIRHANIVSIRESFTTRAFGDSSIVFVYEYYPCSITLHEAYFSPQAQALLHARFHASGGISNMLETTLWSFITQLASALKVIHRSGLSARIIGPGKILMTSKNRLRINHTAILDVLQYDLVCDANTVAMHQQEDLISLGKLVVSLACLNSSSATAAIHGSNILQALEYVSKLYSPDFKSVAIYLLGKPSVAKSIDEVFTFIGPRLLHELNSSHYYSDNLESNMSLELENSRLVRLLSKLNFINERPEYDEDQRWSESGDRYMIKLFRDYIFHQVDDLGAPMTDMTHVITCLNKLDAGVDEKILLTSRDNETTTMIVTYKELKACIAAAFHDVFAKKLPEMTETAPKATASTNMLNVNSSSASTSSRQHSTHNSSHHHNNNHHHHHHHYPHHKNKSKNK